MYQQLPALGQLFAYGQFVQDMPGQRFYLPDLGITHQETAHRAGHNRDFDGQRNGRPGRRENGRKTVHHGLHGQRTRYRSQAGQIFAGDSRIGPMGGGLATIEPTRDGVAAEVDDTPAVAMHFVDQCSVDAIELAREFLGATLRTQFPGQG